MLSPCVDPMSPAVILLLTMIIISPGYTQLLEIRGDVQRCLDEGKEVELQGILKYSPCFFCKCQDGHVQCEREKCLSVDDCYMVTYRKNQCCGKCKGCQENGSDYESNTKWVDKEDACEINTCNAGVLTKYRQQCYTSCSSPLPAPVGQCCPLCPGCSLQGKTYREGEVAYPNEDPCATCHCRNGSFTCQKETCPVLPCPPRDAILKPGECCPICRGTRKIETTSKRQCNIGGKTYRSGKRFRFDDCTRCVCQGSTALCQRKSCPILSCPPRLQVTDPGQCCPQCQQAEEARAVCRDQRGQIHKEGETWSLDSCAKCSCRRGEILCAKESCQPSTCPPGQKQVRMKNECCPKCQEEDAVCSVFGDPHYRTFDGKTFDFQGPCKYILAKDCGHNSFSIRVSNDVRSSKFYSWTKTVSLRLGKTKVTLGQRLRVKVDRKKVKLPHIKLGEYSVIEDKNGVTLRTNIGVKVLWDGDSYLEVSVPSSFKNRMCGLCGNFNGKKSDDMATRSGEAAANLEKFANSWKVGGYRSCSRHGGTNNHAGSSCSKDWGRRVLAVKKCNQLKSPLFSACHQVVNPIRYVSSCLKDMCECESGQCYCQALMAYSRDCERNNIMVEWRNQTQCLNNHCPIGAVQTKCSPECKLSCKNYLKASSCKQHCSKQCQCPVGTVLRKKRCIDPKNCPR